MSDKTVEIYTDGIGKGFAPKNADKSKTAKVKIMNPLTRIFDLKLRGKDAEFEKRIRKLNKADTETLYQAVILIAGFIENASKPEPTAEPAPNGTQRPINTRG